MTVGELKKIIENISDNTDIVIEYYDNDMWQDIQSSVNSWRISNDKYKDLILSEFYT